MKRFNWKAAIITFVSLIVIIGVLALIGNKWFTKPIMLLIMLPGIPVYFLFPFSIAAGDDYTWDYFQFALASGISASVWSMLVGFFTRRVASQQPTEVE